MAGEVDNTIIACSYSSSSFPCFNTKKSINNLMITNNRCFTIFLGFKVMSTRHLLNLSPQCTLKLDLEIKVDLGRCFCQFCCIIQVIHRPHFHVQCNRCSLSHILFELIMNSKRYNCSCKKILFLGYTMSWKITVHDLWSFYGKHGDLSWAKHETQHQEYCEI